MDSMPGMLRGKNKQPQPRKANYKLRMTNYKNLMPKRRGPQTSQRKRYLRHPATAITVWSADTAKNAASAPANNAAVLALTASGARKVEAALVELNACRAESGIEAQQFSTCQARAEADEAEVKRLNVSAASLNRALDAKDKILALQQSESQAELRAARGTFLGRLARLAEHVAIGMAMGVAIGVAVK